MVRIGFITEGNADKILLTSEKFKKYLKHKHHIVFDDGDIKYLNGKSGVKTNLKPFLSALKESEVDYVFILVDQDNKQERNKRKKKYKYKDCPVDVVNEIKQFRDNEHYQNENLIYVVMTRELEAWFLADPNLGFDCEGKNPEEIIDPSELVSKHLKTRSHGRIAHKVKDNFSLERAAENSKSAKRFLNKLIEIRGEEESF